MSLQVGSIIAKIEADVSGFLGGMDKASQKAQSFSKGLGGITDVAGKVAGALGLVVGAYQIVDFLNDSSQAAKAFDKSMISLDVIAGQFGVSGKKAQETAKQLASELRIGVGGSAEGLQNLLKSGLNLEQSADLMRRFTNEALTGKSANISLEQAVQNLSFAYATGNSALGNMSGISENFSDITERGRNILIAEGIAVKDITDNMAKYRGMIELTNLTKGSSERFTGTLIDKEAQLEMKINELKVTVGKFVNVFKAGFIDQILNSGVFERLTSFFANLHLKVELLKGPLQESIKYVQDFFIAWAQNENVIRFFTLLSGYLDKITGGFLALKERLFDALQIDTNTTLIQFFQMLQNAILPSINELIRQVQQGFTNWLDSMGGFEHVFGMVMNVVTTLSNLIANMLTPIINTLIESFARTKPKLDMLLQQLGPYLMNTLIVLGIALGTVITIFLALFSAIVEGVAYALPYIIIALTGFMEFLNGFVGIVVGIFTLNWQMVWDNTVLIFQGIFRFLVGILGGILAFIEGFVRGIIDFFKSLYMTLVGASIVPDMVNAIISWFARLKDFAFSIFASIVNFIINVWSNAFATVTNILNTAKNFITSTLNSVFSFISNWGGQIINALVSPFRNAWAQIEGLINKIKDGLDFTKRHSPSVVDIVNKGVGLVNDALGGLDYGLNVNSHANVAMGGASVAMPSGGGGPISLVINMDGAMIADEFGAQKMAGIVGDAIIKKLQTNVKF